MAVALDPKSIAGLERRYVRVETAGNFTRGLMVVDRRPRSTETPNVNIVTKLNIERVKELSIAMLG